MQAFNELRSNIFRRRYFEWYLLFAKIIPAFAF